MRKDKTLKEIGMRLRALRRERGFGLEEFARYLGISPKTLNRYETGGINIPIKRLLKICQLLDVSIETLTGGVGYAERKQREAGSQTHH